MANATERSTWIDITVPIRPGMVTFEGDPLVHLERTASLAAGDVCNVSRLDFGVHTGTHVDAPVHFIADGAGVESTPLDALVGRALVVDVGHVEGQIDRAAIEGLDIPPGTERLLLRSNGSLWDETSFQGTFRALTPDGATALVDRGLRLVGNDYLSIAPFGDPTDTHRTLLRAGVVVVEGIDLRTVEPGEYDLICLPLLIPGSDGGPARAILRPAAR